MSPLKQKILRKCYFHIAMKIWSFPWVFVPSSVHTFLFSFYPNIALFGLSFSLVLPIPYIYDICISSSQLAIILYSVFLISSVGRFCSILVTFASLTVSLFRRVRSHKKILLCVMSVRMRYQRSLMRT
jgi:hypothetical protein